MYADMEDSDDDENHDANDIWEKEKMSSVAAATRNKRGNNGAFLKKMYYIRGHHSRYPPPPCPVFSGKEGVSGAKLFIRDFLTKKFSGVSRRRKKRGIWSDTF